MISVNDKLEDLKVVATASMYPVNTKFVRPVSSAEGVLPTQMPPLACILLVCCDLLITGFLKDMRLKPSGAAAEGDFVSTRAMTSVLSSRVISEMRVRLGSLLWPPLQFQKRMDTSAFFTGARGHGVLEAGSCLGVDLQRKSRQRRQVSSMTG